MSFATIIVDDEPLARERVRSFLGNHSQIHVLAECSNGVEAARQITLLRPDLVFLDIQMPELDGFGVLRSLEPHDLPAVVFVTAHHEHALAAFEANAVDYLLKPFDRRRFDRAVGKALNRCRERQLGNLDQQLVSLLQHVREQQSSPKLALQGGSGTVFLRPEEIDWIEGDRNYVLLHVGDEVHRVRETLTGIETRLDNEQFLRIHRSVIVNLDRVRRFRSGLSPTVELEDGTQLTIGRAYRSERLRRLMSSGSA